MALKAKSPVPLEENRATGVGDFCFSSSINNLKHFRQKVKSFDRELSIAVDCALVLWESEHLSNPLDRLAVGHIRRRLENRILRGVGE